MTLPPDTKLILIVTHDESFRAPSTNYFGPFEDAEHVNRHVELCEYDEYEVEYHTVRLYAPESE